MLSKADIEVSLIYYICSTVPETKKINGKETKNRKLVHLRRNGNSRESWSHSWGEESIVRKICGKYRFKLGVKRERIYG